ncbi:MAG: hypothetical protein K6T83_13035, partial [Alicyclobacillus sp.]|nr:hypothetical protein [Alicyclobacillus sp.]
NGLVDTIFFLSSWGEVLLCARKTLAVQGLVILQGAHHSFSSTRRRPAISLGLSLDRFNGQVPPANLLVQPLLAILSS